MDKYKDVWAHALDYLRDHAGFSPATFSIWFKDLKLEGISDTFLYLSAEKQHQAEYVFDMFYKQLQSATFNALGTRAELILFSREKHGANIESYIENHKKTGVLPEGAKSRETISEEFVKEPPLSEEEARQIPDPVGVVIRSTIPPVQRKSGIVDEYTFENFIVGETNKMAYSACRAIAKNPAESWNPLFLYSPSGLGKTHLLYAISNEIIKNDPSKTVLYVRGEDFANDLIEQLMEKKPMHYFRQRYRKVDVLLVDDIQFIAGKEATQTEFFHTFDALYQQNKQIILTSDRPTRDLKHLESRLRTRFESGLMVDIQPPELELRIAIVRSKAENMGITIPEKVVLYLAENVKSSVRQLEGAVKRLHGYSTINGLDITLDLAKKCLVDITPRESVDDLVQKTFDVVCRHYDVKVSEVLGKRRQANIVIARHVATFILRQITELSSIEISRYFSQDHSTSLSAINKVEEKIADDPAFEETVNSLIREIKED
ncbi:MAG: chromosomal replication initiator protein DnaA [Clostridia bacterium]|nr:chromosomal replication initiator protein DnaA [Clostridia bacterium]